MHLLSRVVGVSFVLLCCLSLSVAFAEQKMEGDKDILKVGSIVLTQTDLDLRIQKIVPMQLSFHGGMKAEKMAEINEQALDDLITVSYKSLYAIAEELSVDSATFENEWEKMLSKTKNFSEKAQPYVWSKVRADLYRNLLATRAEEVAVNERIKVTDEEVSTYYAENKEMFFLQKTHGCTYSNNMFTWITMSRLS